jgi:hypothetical protein
MTKYLRRNYRQRLKRETESGYLKINWKADEIENEFYFIDNKVRFPDTVACTGNI